MSQQQGVPTLQFFMSHTPQKVEHFQQSQQPSVAIRNKTPQHSPALSLGCLCPISAPMGWMIMGVLDMYAEDCIMGAWTYVVMCVET
jgi:hypothetical protein